MKLPLPEAATAHETIAHMENLQRLLEELRQIPVDIIVEYRQRLKERLRLPGPGPHHIDPNTFSLRETPSADGGETFEMEAVGNFQPFDRTGFLDPAVFDRSEHAAHPRVNTSSLGFILWNLIYLAAEQQGMRGEFRSAELTAITRKGTIPPKENLALKAMIHFKPRGGPRSHHRELLGMLTCTFHNAAGKELASETCNFMIARELRNPEGADQER